MAQRYGQLIFDGTLRYAQFVCNLIVRQAFLSAHEIYFPASGGEGFQAAVDVFFSILINQFVLPLICNRDAF